jgi:hypothetical protein
MKGQLVEGKNPRREKEKEADEQRFGEAFQMLIEMYAKIENAIGT